MSQANETRSAPGPRAHTLQALRRNRLLLMGGLVTVLPAAAIAPTLVAPGGGPARAPVLAAIDDIASAAQANEAAVARAAGLNGPRSPSVPPMLLVCAKPPAQPQPEPIFGMRGILASNRESHSPAAIGLVSMAPEPIRTDPDLRWFNGRPVRPARTLSMLVTAYSPDERSCGESADGITASGYSVWTNGMRLVAADTDILPFGSLVSVAGYDEGSIVPVLDRGGAIKGHRLDVLFSQHAQAQQWGVRRIDVVVWEYADGLPADFQMQPALASRE